MAAGSVYGLKQAPRCWRKRFSGFLMTLGFEMCKSVSSLYVAKNNEDIVYLVLYVDDGLIISWSSFNIF